MNEPTNTDRARWAKNAIDFFAEETGLMPDIEEDEREYATAVADLLSDIIHFCNQNEINFFDALDRAEMNFDAEVHEEIEEVKEQANVADQAI